MVAEIIGIKLQPIKIANLQGDQIICQGNHSVIARDVLGANRIMSRVPPQGSGKSQAPADYQCRPL